MAIETRLHATVRGVIVIVLYVKQKIIMVKYVKKKKKTCMHGTLT